ncbi:MAG: hypothetical protein AAF657_12700 [Acidobacteriota bacterium]
MSFTYSRQNTRAQAHHEMPVHPGEATMRTNSRQHNSRFATALPIALALLAAPAVAQVTESGFNISDGLVIGKSYVEKHVVLDLFGTTGDGRAEAACPPFYSGELLAEACDLFEVGDQAIQWVGVAPDAASELPGYYQMSSVTIGFHGNYFAIRDGIVIDKRTDGAHVILTLLAKADDFVLEVLCPFDQPGASLAEACNMIRVGDVASLWDGFAPDPASDFPKLHRLTSVTIGDPIEGEARERELLDAIGELKSELKRVKALVGLD